MRPEDTAGFGPVGTNATAPQPLTAAHLAEIRGRHDLLTEAMDDLSAARNNGDGRPRMEQIDRVTDAFRPADIAALLADNERLRGVIRHVIAMDAVSLGWKAELRAEIGDDSHG